MGVLFRRLRILGGFTLYGFLIHAIVDTVRDEFPCGNNCTCYTDVHTSALVVDCSNLKLKEIPQNIPNYPDWLMSGNNISSLNQKILHRSLLYNITHLDISRNRLVNISKEFIDLFINNQSRLSFLDISNNNLTMLPRSIQNISSLETLRLSGNPFKCSCENTWMKDWLNNTAIIPDTTNISCQMPSGKEISILYMNPKDLNCSLKNTKDNSWKIPVIVVFCLLTVIAIIYRKWKAIKRCLDIRFADEATENVKDMDYDAFVNYSVENERWVLDHLIDFLESDELHYKLCIHGRDFVPGNTIMNNICTAIEHSRRFIAVVTRDFLKSGWCKEEFTMAHTELVQGRENFIIFVMVDDIEIDDLPKVMKSFVKIRTYIEAIDLNNKKSLDLFRKKLHFSMPETPLNNIPRAVCNPAAQNENFPPLFNRLNRYEDYNRRMNQRDVL